MKDKENYLNFDVDVLNGLAAFLGYVLIKRRTMQEIDLDDIDSVREMLKVYRPEKIEYEYFDAVIQMHRGYVSQCISTLRHLIEHRPHYPSAKCLLAYALFIQRDVSWEALATEVLENTASVESEVIMMKILLKRHDLQKGIITEEEFLRFMETLPSKNKDSSAQNILVAGADSNKNTTAKISTADMPNYAVRM